MRLEAALLVFAAILAAPTTARAQGTARSMDIDTSVRSSGMAGASTAVFFGDELNAWANPALLGYVSGLRYRRTSTQLVPGLASDVDFDTEHLQLGGGGVGLVFSGRPAFEGVKLDYGSDPAFDGFERVKSWGFGVSVLRAVESAQRAAGHAPTPRSERADVSFGMNFKRTRVAFDPFFGEDTGNTIDWGVLARATPIDRKEGVPLRLSAAAGFSILNANDEIFFKDSFFGGAPPTRQRRAGMAMNLTLDPPAWGMAASGSRPWYLEGLSPLLSFGLAADWVHASAGGRDAGFDTWGVGIEASFLEMLSLRGGYYDDEKGNIKDPTFGFALALPVGKVAGARYEHSMFPQARNSGIDDLQRDSFTIWLHPLALWSASRRAPQE